MVCLKIRVPVYQRKIWTITQPMDLSIARMVPRVLNSGGRSIPYDRREYVRTEMGRDSSGFHDIDFFPA
ncbi:MAG: hypothetical protein C4519_24895 [Desulfobacteraceae bacterium]|nr:MAG: hypothetical protein C4519_24895 [Desulfobacteraceae bacterium]